jgi:endonuclease/exonuclease/phosphatase family metal-dependent hydrolase
MNAHESSESMRLIRDGVISAYGQDWTAPVTFADTFRVANGDQANGNTGFGVKIDYVYTEHRLDPAFRVEGASIRGDAPGGSDHFPVMAQVVLLG